MCKIHHLAVILHVTTLFIFRNVLACSELCNDFTFQNPSSRCFTSVTTLKQATAFPFLPCFCCSLWLFQWLFPEWSPPCPYFPYSFETVMTPWWSYHPFRISGQSDSS